MVDTVKSATAREGGQFRFRITETVTIEDGTVIEEGTPGFGVIRSASPAARGNHDGIIALEPRYLMVRKPQGGWKRVEVSMDPTLPPVWTANETVLSKASNLLPVPGFVVSSVNAFRWGRNISLGPGFVFAVIPIPDLSKAPIC
jgi:hypothetical protein